MGTGSVRCWRCPEMRAAFRQPEHGSSEVLQKNKRHLFCAPLPLRRGTNVETKTSRCAQSHDFYFRQLGHMSTSGVRAPCRWEASMEVSACNS